MVLFNNYCEFGQLDKNSKVQINKNQGSKLMVNTKVITIDENYSSFLEPMFINIK